MSTAWFWTSGDGFDIESATTRNVVGLFTLYWTALRQSLNYLGQLRDDLCDVAESAEKFCQGRCRDDPRTVRAGAEVIPALSGPLPRWSPHCQGRCRDNSRTVRAGAEMIPALSGLLHRWSRTVRAGAEMIPALSGLVHRWSRHCHGLCWDDVCAVLDSAESGNNLRG